MEISGGDPTPPKEKASEIPIYRGRGLKNQ